MSSSNSGEIFRVAALSAVKHGYVPEGVHAHPRFEVVVVADDADRPDWTHARNQKLADDLGVSYIRDVEKALTEFDVQVAVVSSKAERHCDLSVRAADKGLHVVQDKPMSTELSECDRVVESVERNGVKFLMWNRNTMPAVLEAHAAIESGAIGDPYAVHMDFYFAKDAGPQKTANEPGNPPINWLESLKSAHADGGDGGVGNKPMGELEIEGIYPLAHVLMLTGAKVNKVFARTASHFYQRNVDNYIDDLSTVTLEMEPSRWGVPERAVIPTVAESRYTCLARMALRSSTSRAPKSWCSIGESRFKTPYTNAYGESTISSSWRTSRTPSIPTGIRCSTLRPAVT